MERYFKMLITIIIVVIVLIIITIFLVNKFINDSFESSSEGLENNVDEFNIEYGEENQDIIYHDTFFNVEQCIQYYLDYIKDNNIDAIYKVLDTKYISRNNITRQNIETKLDLKDKGTILIIDNMKSIHVDQNINVIETEGKIINSETSLSEKFNMVVVLDVSNSVFSIVPDVNSDVNLEIVADDEDYYNEIDYKLYSQEDIVNKYMEYYKILAQFSPEDLFSILDDEYKKKRFENSLDYFKEYLQQMDIDNIYENKYSVNVYMDYTQYICMDKNNNYYIFDEISPMKISVKLDTYTIEDEKYITKYNDSSDEVKVNTNVNKVIKMINTKDYKNAFKLLNVTFRDNNYLNEQEFKENMSDILYEYNNVKLNSIENINNNYVCDLSITSTNEFEEDVISMKMVIKLKEGTDFEYSFSVEKGL